MTSGLHPQAIERYAADAPGLEMLLLFGSRARGDFRAESDWDFGYLAAPGFDADGLLADLVLHLGTDRVDLVDLSRASGLLRFRAAKEGRLLWEASPETFERFWFETVSFWCDMQPILQQGYEDVLARVGV
jgi:predicted nucleotidyltransferase